jgi:hypothetical protein
MQKYIKRKNVPAIGEIQRESGENPEEELHTLVTVSFSGTAFLQFSYYPSFGC